MFFMFFELLGVFVVLGFSNCSKDFFRSGHLCDPWDFSWQFFLRGLGGFVALGVCLLFFFFLNRILFLKSLGVGGFNIAWVSSFL